ncbi:tripartite tricarboxylate transporter substrate binding protein [Polynucleobacter sp. IMCC 30228]|uniref:tripartite tricarboxylate transporter substrate binding protein n=1 Tax=Polynucleobacter sp. IMCC 30228 TaxID=2781011 RepID=UPI001F2AE7C2|nr:tripartite tricarboxylate transporter substrate binding protein [Polynucleobacter sp. IMCC 30228]MCE7527512.1 tripartite tricarboxylate transporter substrate binding protein [Polynucleobacter sp. IMCC 30228]
MSKGTYKLRKFFIYCCVMLPLLMGSSFARAAWPDKPIRIIVPFVAGGAADSAARLLAPGLQKRLGKPVLIENIAGAGATIGTAAVATAPADGYTLLMGSASNAISNSIQKKMPYVFERDLVPLLLVGEVPGVVVVPSALPVKNMADLIAYVKAHDGEINYGSPGYGTSVHMAGELFQSMTSTTMIHVPYKGASAAITDLLGMRLQLMFPALAAAQPQIQAGTLRALAVTTRKRSPLAPDLPTVSESGLAGYEVGGWIGLFVPKGVSVDIIKTLQDALYETLKDESIRNALLKAGIEVTPASAQILRERVETDTRRWEQIIKKRKMELQ